MHCIDTMFDRQKTLVMGILNCNNDSFFGGSRFGDMSLLYERARKMTEAGVDIIDIGGESSRPGSKYIPADEEIKRVVPALEAIMSIPGRPVVSIDTRKYEVAKAAYNEGAGIINDISGLRDDSKLIRFVANKKLPVVLMHMRGTPETMQQNPGYSDTIDEIARELESICDSAVHNGISKDQIIIDPGIGFGKRFSDNIKILKHIDRFCKIGYPVLIGLSRKSFLEKITGKKVEDRLAGTIAANTIAVMNGARIVRVHDASQSVDMARIIDAVNTTN